MTEQTTVPRFGGTDHEGSLRGHFTFELKSRFWRLFHRRKRAARHALLQIGSGGNPRPDFDNVDFYQNRFWASKHIGHDLRLALPFPDNAFEGAYSEHTLEHLYPRHGQAMLREIWRVLKPGGIFRCSVPDLGKYIQFYNGELPNDEFRQFSSGCQAIWNLTQNFSHLAVWDYEMLSANLHDAGFSIVTRRTFGEGADSRLLIDRPDRAWESLYVEAVK